MRARYFTPESFDFLVDLAMNTNRDRFMENRQRCERTIRTPAPNLFSDIATDPATISPHFLALPKKVGGSLLRMHRGGPFSRDKSPYKTGTEIQFRHEMGRDIPAPDFYLHIEKNSLGTGLWRTDSATMEKICDAIIGKSDAWIAARDNSAFSKQFVLEGDSLKNAPRDYVRDRPAISDLKRKCFVAIAPISDRRTTSSDFPGELVGQFSLAAPIKRFLCRVLELRF